MESTPPRIIETHDNEDSLEIIHDTQDSTSTGKTSRRRKSHIWEHFIEDPSNNQRAICKYCQTSYSNPVGGGLGSLIRHYTRKHKDKEENVTDLKQSKIQIEEGSSMINWKYNQTKCMEGLAKVLIKKELPFNFAEDKDIEAWLVECVNPQFRGCSRNTIKKIILSNFEQEKTKLIQNLVVLFCKISLTSDIWTGPNNYPYICITAHWIDIKWNLQKRLLSFRIFDYPHTGQAIASMLEDICKEYKIISKIATISFDNASNNNSAVKILTTHFNPMLNGILFHCRCSCHILNLIVQECYKLINPYLKMIRKSIHHIVSSPSRFQLFRKLCTENNMPVKKFPLDVEHRWNSTYLMLSSCIPYENLITNFINFNSKGDITLDANDWKNCKTIHDFLQIFYNATNQLSGIYYPTSSILLLHLFNITKIFNDHRNEPTFMPIIEAMELKYMSYWEDPPMWACLAFVMDPRYKLKVTQKCIHQIFTFTNKSSKISTYNEQIKNNLYKLFDEYNTAYGTNNASSSCQGASSSSAPTVGANIGFWDVMDKLSSEFDSETSNTELETYLEASFVFNDAEKLDLDVLQWWYNNAGRFPIVSKIARDLLTIPASTVASESAFSAGKRIISDRRTRLSERSVESSVCLKDWYYAEQRMQNLNLNEDVSDEE